MNSIMNELQTKAKRGIEMCVEPSQIGEMGQIELRQYAKDVSAAFKALAATVQNDVWIGFDMAAGPEELEENDVDAVSVPVSELKVSLEAKNTELEKLKAKSNQDILEMKQSYARLTKELESVKERYESLTQNSRVQISECERQIKLLESERAAFMEELKSERQRAAGAEAAYLKIIGMRGTEINKGMLVQPDADGEDGA